MARGRKSPYVISLVPVERVALEHWQGTTTLQVWLAHAGTDYLVAC